MDTLFSLNLPGEGAGGGVCPVERLNSRNEGLSLGYFIIFTGESLQLGTFYTVEFIIKETNWGKLYII